MKAACESGPEPNTEFVFFFTLPLPYSLAFLEMLFHELPGKSFRCPIVLTVMMLLPALMANLHFSFKPLHLVITFSATVNNLHPLLYLSSFPRIEIGGDGSQLPCQYSTHTAPKQNATERKPNARSRSLIEKCCYQSFPFSHPSAYRNSYTDVCQCCGIYTLLGTILGASCVNVPVMLAIFNIVLQCQKSKGLKGTDFLPPHTHHIV